MASKSTYAKLIKPPQFSVDDEAIFRLEYSRDLTCSYATLRFFNFGLGLVGCQDTYTDTHYINTSESGTGIEEFVLAPNTLGYNPTSDILTVSVSGLAKAVVEIGNTLNEDGTVVPLYTSNEIVLDFVWMWEKDFWIDANTSMDNTSVTATGSTQTVWIRQVPRDAVNSYGSCSINSYKFLFYDENYNHIGESETFYDWNDSTRYAKYLCTGLENNKKYYVRAKATLVGGYTIYTSNYLEINVKYADIPTISSDLQLSNDVMRGCVGIVYNGTDTYTKMVVSRSVVDEDNYIELKSINGNVTGAILRDYYALPNVSYIYKLVLYNGTDIVATHYNTITHKFNGLCISDYYGSYATEVFQRTYNINKNNRAGIAEPMDNKYPYAIVNGTLDYDSGGFNATFAEVADECNYNFNPDGNMNTVYSSKVRHWLNNGRTKLLKLDNGEAWLVSTSENATNGTDTGLAETTFSWTQVGDATDMSQYVEMGLIVNE